MKKAKKRPTKKVSKQSATGKTKSKTPKAKEKTDVKYYFGEIQRFDSFPFDVYGE